MRREDFVFTVGFDGATAVVDGQMRRRHGRESVAGLLEAGAYRAAACAALWSRDEADLRRIVDAYNEASGSSLRSAEDLGRLFGIPLQVLDEGSAQRIKVQLI